MACVQPTNRGSGLARPYFFPAPSLVLATSLFHRSLAHLAALGYALARVYEVIHEFRLHPFGRDICVRAFFFLPPTTEKVKNSPPPPLAAPNRPILSGQRALGRLDRAFFPPKSSPRVSVNVVIHPGGFCAVAVLRPRASRSATRRRSSPFRTIIYKKLSRCQTFFLAEPEQVQPLACLLSLVPHRAYSVQLFGRKNNPSPPPSIMKECRRELWLGPYPSSSSYGPNQL